MANHERGATWYAIAGTILLIIAAYGILSGAWSIALVSVLTAGLYVLLRDHRHGSVTATLSTTGVRIGDAYMHWQEVQGYWLLRTPEYTEIHFVPIDPRKPQLHIQTGSQSLSELQRLLQDFVPELTDKKEGLVDMFLRLYKL